MSTTTVILSALAAVGLLLAASYGVIATAQLVRIRRLPSLPPRGGPTSTDASEDTPDRRFEGETFEGSWQGSQGYDRQPGPGTDGNLADRLFVATFTPLRPSRFGDSSYWNRYLPGVLVMYLGLFIGVPVVVALIAQPTTGPISTFTPTPGQRAVPGSGSYVSQPSDCTGTASRDPAGGRTLPVDFADDGTVLGVHPGDVMAVTYLYGKPLFSPGSPLCPDPPDNADGAVRYVAASSGSGFIYLPQPNGTVVVQIEVHPTLSALQWLFVIVVLAVVVVDVVLTVLLRRSVRARYSR